MPAEEGKFLIYSYKDRKIKPGASKKFLNFFKFDNIFSLSQSEIIRL